MNKVNSFILASCICICLCSSIIAGCSLVPYGFHSTETYQIELSGNAAGEKVMEEIKSYFTQIGFELRSKIHKIYPKEEEIEYYKTKTVNVLLVVVFDRVTVRLEKPDKLYIDWTRHTDSGLIPPQSSLDELHKKIAGDLKTRLGMDVTFKRIENP